MLTIGETPDQSLVNVLDEPGLSSNNEEEAFILYVGSLGPSLRLSLSLSLFFSFLR
jgi:hypothetical protein